MTIDPKTMAVVEHFAEGQKPKILETLDEAWFDYIKGFLNRESLSPSVASFVVSKLQELAAQKRWLMCGCQGEHSEDSPVFFPKSLPQHGARKATLVHLYDRPKHSDVCGLARKRPLSLGGISGLPHARKVKGLAVLKAMGFQAALRDDLGHRDPQEMAQAERMPTLARVLFTCLEGASLNRSVLNNPSLSDQMKMLSAYIGKQFLDAQKQVAAKPWFALSFGELDALSAKIVSRKLSFGAVLPQGFVIDLVHNHKTEKGCHVLTAKKAEVAYEGRLFIPGEGTAGPWLAIALVALLPGQATAQISQVYLHPLARSGSYLLVDSGLERNTLRLLEKAQWKLGRKTPFEIIKPLTDRIIEGQRVRPDFVLKGKSKQLVVETMGFNDDEYLEQKERMHDLMRKLPNVVELFAHDDGVNDDGLRKLVDWFAQKWALV